MEGFAKIEILEDIELEIIETYNEETDEADSYSETFMKGNTEEVDIINSNEDFVDFQFGDGSVSLGVPKNVFRIIEIE